jgi:predicted RecA/RadA family phage recombinase
VTSGQGVLVGNLFGVAAKTATEGESVEIATVGVYELPKLASAVIAAGARVAWDDTAKQVVLPGAGKAPIGIAIEAAGNGAATVRVRLNGVATAAA